jgi:hypothetical protein
VTQKQLTDSEVGQITGRHNAAVTNLGSSSVDVQLGGVYALQHVMQDYPSYQPTVITVLCAFARDQKTPIPPSGSLRPLATRNRPLWQPLCRPPCRGPRRRSP